ncbi:MAG: hypothetical protein ABJH91_02115 [Balneola sp.]
MNRKRYEKKDDHGQTLFKVVFITTLVLAIISLCIAIINFDEESLTLFLGLSVFLFFASLVFKFFESVIELLQKKQ